MHADIHSRLCSNGGECMSSSCKAHVRRTLYRTQCTPTCREHERPRELARLFALSGLHDQNHITWHYENWFEYAPFLRRQLSHHSAFNKTKLMESSFAHRVDVEEQGSCFWFAFDPVNHLPPVAHRVSAINATCSQKMKGESKTQLRPGKTIKDPESCSIHALPGQNVGG